MEETEVERIRKTIRFLRIQTAVSIFFGLWGLVNATIYIAFSAYYALTGDIDRFEFLMTAFFGSQYLTWLAIGFLIIFGGLLVFRGIQKRRLAKKLEKKLKSKRLFIWDDAGALLHQANTHEPNEGIEPCG